MDIDEIRKRAEASASGLPIREVSVGVREEKDNGPTIASNIFWTGVLILATLFVIFMTPSLIDWSADGDIAIYWRAYIATHITGIAFSVIAYIVRKNQALVHQHIINAIFVVYLIALLVLGTHQVSKVEGFMVLSGIFFLSFASSFLGYGESSGVEIGPPLILMALSPTIALVLLYVGNWKMSGGIILLCLFEVVFVLIFNVISEIIATRIEKGFGI